MPSVRWRSTRRTSSARPDDASQSETALARPAEWPDVFHLLGLLEATKVEYVLVGGYALGYNGLVRQTGDVDILVRNSPDNNRKWIAALMQLPRGAASELVATSDDPFSVGGDGELLDEPGVIRVVDEFVVDVMPKACGLSIDDLAPYIQRVRYEGSEYNVLDLYGLRLTKQGVRLRDRDDLIHIEALLSALKGKVTEHMQTMSRRSFEAETWPTRGGTRLRADAELDERERLRLAQLVLQRAARDGGPADCDADTIALYCDRETLTAILRQESPLSDLRSALANVGVELPRPPV
jgi:hypothetical protein